MTNDTARQFQPTRALYDLLKLTHRSDFRELSDDQLKKLQGHAEDVIEFGLDAIHAIGALQFWVNQMPDDTRPSSREYVDDIGVAIQLLSEAVKTARYFNSEAGYILDGTFSREPVSAPPPQPGGCPHG